MTNTENDKTLFPERFLLIRIVFLQHIRYHFKLRSATNFAIAQYQPEQCGAAGA